MTPLTCAVCRGESFDETETGFYVCVRCGTQSQDVVRDVEDEELMFNSVQGRGARRRRVRDPSAAAMGAGTCGPQTGGASDGSKAAASIAASMSTGHEAILEQVMAYCEGLQRLILAQCTTLSRRYGCPPDLPRVARAIWFPYLHATGILDLDFGDPQTYKAPGGKHAQTRGRYGGGVRAAATRGGAVRDDDDDDVTEDERDHRLRRRHREADGRRRALSDDPAMDGGEDADASASSPRTLRRLITAKLPTRLSLSVSYLAALWVRAPVHPGDVVRWALDGDLPYLGESARAVALATGQAATVQATGPGPVRRRMPFKHALLARNVPQAHLVAHLAAIVAAEAGLGPLPPVNAAALVARYASELGVPRLTGCAHRMLSIYMAPGLRHGGSLAEPPSRRVHAHGDGEDDEGEGELNGEDAELNGANQRRAQRGAAFGAIAPPHVHAMAVLVATLKVLYGLDGRTATLVSKRRRPRQRQFLSEGSDGVALSVTEAATAAAAVPPPPAEGWVAWARNLFSRRASAPHQPLAAAAAALAGDVDGSAADAFIAYCREHALAGLRPTHPYDRYAAALWSLHRHLARREEQARSSDRHRQPPGGAEEQRRRDATYDVQDAGASFDPLIAGVLARLEFERSAASGRPRPAGAYHPCGRRLDDTPRDYRAVIEACAAHVWAEPRALHEAVRDLDAVLGRYERRMAAEAERAKRARVKLKLRREPGAVAASAEDAAEMSHPPGTSRQRMLPQTSAKAKAAAVSRTNVRVLTTAARAKVQAAMAVATRDTEADPSLEPPTTAGGVVDDERRGDAGCEREEGRVERGGNSGESPTPVAVPTSAATPDPFGSQPLGSQHLGSQPGSGGEAETRTTKRKRAGDKHSKKSKKAKKDGDVATVSAEKDARKSEKTKKEKKARKEKKTKKTKAKSKLTEEQ